MLIFFKDRVLLFSLKIEESCGIVWLKFFLAEMFDKSFNLNFHQIAQNMLFGPLCSGFLECGDLENSYTISSNS